MEIKKQFRATLADLVGATPEEIVLTQNTTDGVNLALNGMPWQAGDELVTDDFEHSSGLVPSYLLRHKFGIGVNIVRLDAQDSPGVVLEKFDAAITPRTRALVVSHICYTTGLMLPLKELHELAHRKGAVVVVDAAQSVGQMPVNLRDLNADYYAFPCHKWVMGPWGMGGFFVRRDLLPDLMPTAVSGHAAARHDTLGDFELATDTPEKFELTTSSTALMAGATNAVEMLQEQGMEAIFAHSLALGERLRARLDGAEGTSILSPRGGPLATGLVTVGIPDTKEPRAFSQALWEQYNVVQRSVAYPGGVRLSLAYFNTAEEVDRVADGIAALARS
jgi:L-cysteine/cystine lyase